MLNVLDFVLAAHYAPYFRVFGVRRLKNHAAVTGGSKSALVRDALENYLREVPTSSSAYDLARAAGLIGCVDGAPPDLSSDREHFRV